MSARNESEQGCVDRCGQAHGKMTDHTDPGAELQTEAVTSLSEKWSGDVLASWKRDALNATADKVRLERKLGDAFEILEAASACEEAQLRVGVRAVLEVLR